MALVCTMSCFLTAVFNDFVWFAALYGFLNGVSFGFVYLPARTSCALYFRKRQALATGISVCGTGVGVMIVPPLTRKAIWTDALSFLKYASGKNMIRTIY